MYIYIYMHIYMYVYMYACMYTYIYVLYIYIYIEREMYVYTHRTLTDDIEQLSLSTLSDNEGDEDLRTLFMFGFYYCFNNLRFVSTNHKTSTMVQLHMSFACLFQVNC